MGRARKVPYSKGMSPVMAALRALVCALIVSFWGAVPALAERRPVAVVNLDLADESKARPLVDQLGYELNVHPELRSLDDSSDSAALKDRIDDPDRNGLDAAIDSKARAEGQLVEFNYDLAANYASVGQRALFTVTPAAATKLFADLALLEGQALLEGAGQLGASRADEARAAFALCARLDPDRTLDAARYLPKVVQEYAKARAAAAAPGSITVKGTGRVWIDGVEVGQAPGGFSVPAGRHVVWLTGAERNVGGAATAVVAGKPSEVTISEGTVEKRTKVQRARIALARAADATAKSAAMGNLAKLVGASDAVLLQVAGDKVIVQTWRAGNVDRSPGFSALRERGKEKPLELLAPLAPPKKIEKPIEGPVVGPKPVVVKRWYQRRSVQLGIAAGLVGAIVGGYFLAQAGADFFTPLSDLGFDTSEMVRK